MSYDATAVALSAAALAEAEHAQTIACQGVMRGYTDLSATTEQKRGYAQCVERIYPEHTGSEAVFFKALIVAAFLGAAFGVWGMRDEDGEGKLLGAICGLLFAPLALLLLLGMVAAVMYLFGMT